MLNWQVGERPERVGGPFAFESFVRNVSLTVNTCFVLQINMIYGRTLLVERLTKLLKIPFCGCVGVIQDADNLHLLENGKSENQLGLFLTLNTR